MSEVPGQENSQLEEDVSNDIDALLEQEDPGFKRDLSQVAEIKPEVELDEEGSLGEITEPPVDDDETEEKSRIRKIGARLKSQLGYRLQRFKLRVRNFIFNIIVFLRTRPKEFFGFLLSVVRSQLKKLKALLQSFGALPRNQKIIVMIVLVMSVAVAFLTLKNLKGVWLPTLNPPIVSSLSDVADRSFSYSAEKFEMFYKAFPRTPDLFLFEKFKVNLKPSAGHPNPMGAFEVVVELDSKDAAVEVQSRQVEFHDLIQREFESQTYPSLLTDLGKQYLKDLIKKNLDERLSQGWVEDVHFQTFILKP